jgi:peroxiredoxin
MTKSLSIVFFIFLTFSLSSQAALANQAAQKKSQTLTKVAGNPDAPDFNLEDQDGNFVKLSDLKGKVVIVNFWATWCPPCRKEMPSMQRAWETLKQEDIEMLAINVGEDSDLIFAFTAEYPVDFPLLMDRDSKVVREWRVRGLPTTFIINPEGKIVYQAIGDREWDSPDLLEQIRQLKKK